MADRRGFTEAAIVPWGLPQLSVFIARFQVDGRAQTPRGTFARFSIQRARFDVAIHHRALVQFIEANAVTPAVFRRQLLERPPTTPT